MKSSNIFVTKPSADYELLDSGEGEKLERFGKFVLSRPDPQALWRKSLDATEWKKADGSFTRDEKKGDWSLKKTITDRWEISFDSLKFWIKPTAFKHTGIFPEQSPNWEWLRGIIATELARTSPQAGVKVSTGRVADTKTLMPLPLGESERLEVLNLFAYTGGATLACAQAGAKVVHVDSSKAALSWARENADLSGLGTKPIRWILDDARDFVRREVKRGRKYAGIIMDPPAFGHGPDSELLKIEEHFLPLVESCMELLSDKPLFFLINGYSAGYSPIAYENDLLPLVKKFGGSIEIGELAIQEKASKDSDGRLLPCGIFARWSK